MREHARVHGIPTDAKGERPLGGQVLVELIRVVVLEKVEWHVQVAKRVVALPPSSLQGRVPIIDLELQPRPDEILEGADQRELLIPHGIERLLDHLRLALHAAAAHEHVRVALAVQVGGLEP